MLMTSGNRSSSVPSRESVTESIDESDEFDEEESQETSRESRAIVLLNYVNGGVSFRKMGKEGQKECT